VTGVSIVPVTVQPTDPIPVPDTGSYDVIHLGDQAAVVVPIADFLPGGLEGARGGRPDVVCAQ